MELNSLSEASLSKKEQKVFNQLKEELSKHPAFAK
jgi:hypothetical protein